MYTLKRQHIYIYTQYAAVKIYIWITELMENGGFYLFAANRKWKLVFLGWQTIDSNQ